MRYDTEEAALCRVAELVDQGYEYIPYDEPKIAVKGVLCWKQKEDGEEDSEIASWAMFGQEYETDSDRISPAELLVFAESHDVNRCDDPKQLRMGFVYYDHVNKKAIVRTTGIVALRKEPEEIMQKFLDKRGDFEDGWSSKRLRRLAEKINCRRKDG